MFKPIWWSCLLFIFVPDADSKQFHAIAGPFKIVIRKVEPCIDQITSEKKWTYFYHDSRRKPGDEMKFSGNYTLPFDLDNSSGGRLRLAVWSSMSGWRDNAHVLHCNEICRCAQFVAPQFWERFLMTTFGEKVQCPHPAGLYTFENVTVDFRNVAIKSFLYGRWRADGHLVLKTGEIGGCIRVFADTVPI